MDAAIELDGVTKSFRVYSERNQTIKQTLLKRRRARYREFRALDDVSLVIPRGTTFGIVGSNGAGKSTMLKVLARILVPDAGTVQINGRATALLELGAGFHPELSGRENIYLNGAILGLPRRTIDRNFDTIVEFAGLREFIENPVKTYSSGMFARLGFSVAVHVDPDVLLIDEVLAVGDESFQRKCAEKIEELRSGGRTCVIVSHSLGQLHTLCDEIAWLDRGKVQAVGDPGDVIEKYVRQVHPDSVVDEAGRVHVGSGEVRIVDAVLEGAVSGSAPQCGRPAMLRVDWTGRPPGGALVVGFTLRRVDGLEVGGTSTPAPIEAQASEGSIRYSMPRLSLLAGSYDVDVMLTDAGRQRVIDHVRHAGRFDVVPSHDHESVRGVVDLLGQWSVEAESSRRC